MAKYSNYTRRGDAFIASTPSNPIEKLPPGVYRFHYDRDMDMSIFNKQTVNYDDLIDIPGTEFDTVLAEMVKFLEPSTKGRFEKYGYLYKRSTLLYGPPGTGKTCIVNRVSEKVIESGGIVLFDPSPRHLDKAFKVLEDIQPETTLLVIFEELDAWLTAGDNDILSILHREIQRTVNS